MIALLAATLCWGTSSAIIGRLGKGTLAATPLLALGAAALLGFLASVRGSWPGTRALLPLTWLGVLEAANALLYFTALHLGPVPLSVALHLTSPILLVLWDCLHGHRPFTAQEFAKVGLIVVGVALVAVEPTENSGLVLVSAALALGSAVVLALLISGVARSAGAGIDADVAAGLQLMIAALLTAPLFIIERPVPGTAVKLLLTGALLLGPGFAFYWRALRGLSPATAGIIGLNEAVVATIVGKIFLDLSVALTAAVGSAAVVLAVGMEIRSRPVNRVPYRRLKR